MIKYVTPQKRYTGYLKDADFITEEQIYHSSQKNSNNYIPNNSTEEEDNPFIYNMGRSAKIQIQFL